MNCRRSEELWTDYLENTLAPPLAHDLKAHFAQCGSCRDLYRTFENVVDSLQGLDVPPVRAGLAERVTRRSRGELRATAARVHPVPHPPLYQWLAMAAVVAFVLIWRPPAFMTGLAQTTSKTAHQTYSFGVRTYHQTERWIEDLNVLRMTVGVAFEDRLDRLNEQLQRFSEDDDETLEDDETQSQSFGPEPSRADVGSGELSRRLT